MEELKEAAAPLRRAKVQGAPLSQKLTNVPMSAVTRVAAWMASAFASLVSVGWTAVTPTVQETATTTGSVLMDSVCAILASPVPNACREAALTTATTRADV